jgi:superfamily II DNA or RNA helicase
MSFGFVVRHLMLNDQTNKAKASLVGNPGWGKTIVAASTVCKLESKRSDSGEQSIVCYYFFNQADPLKSSSTCLAAYQAIAEQIFQKCHQIGAIHDIYALSNDGSKSSA